MARLVSLLHRWWRVLVCRRQLWMLLGVAAVLSGACDGEQSPVEVVRSFMTAVETLNIATAESMVCEARRVKVRESLAPFADIAEPSEAFDLSLSDLVVRELDNDGEVAVVHVSGKLTVSFLGEQETQEIDEEHVVVRENGRWLICDP